MTITLNLQPDIERGLLAKAHAQGVSPADLVEVIVAREVRDQPAPARVPASEAKNLYDLLAPVRGLLTDTEIDTIFRRTHSDSRPIG